MAWSFFAWGLSEEYWDFVRWMEGGRQEGEDIGLGRDSVGGYSYGSVRWMERRTPEEEDIGPGKDSVGGYN